jgi:hypothetical protein
MKTAAIPIRNGDASLNATAGPRVQFRLVSELVPYAKNARTHSDEQIDQIAASMNEFGFTIPVLADGNGIVAGHCRVLAARRLYDAGLTLRLPGGQQIPDDMVPVLDCTGWTDEQRRAYVIADNKLALNAGWDDKTLAFELEELTTNGFDLDAIGFNGEELSRLATLWDNATNGNAISSALHDDRYLVLVECPNEAAQQALFNDMREKGFECKLMN